MHVPKLATSQNFDTSLVELCCAIEQHNKNKKEAKTKSGKQK